MRAEKCNACAREIVLIGRGPCEHYYHIQRGHETIIRKCRNPEQGEHLDHGYQSPYGHPERGGPCAHIDWSRAPARRCGRPPGHIGFHDYEMPMLDLDHKASPPVVMMAATA